MKRILTFFFILVAIFGLSRSAFALVDGYDDSDPSDSQCRDDSYTCSCLSDTEPTSSDSESATSSASGCDAYCGTVNANSYTYSCTLGNGTTEQVAQGNVGSTSTEPVLETATEDQAPDFILPNLIVPIPGFGGFATPTKSANGDIGVNFIADYINAVYGWILSAGALVAVVMMMIGGLQYVMSRGKEKYITKAKTRITNAITGLILIFAAYNIAFLIDPNLTNLRALDVQYVEGIEYFPPEGEDIDIVPNTTLTGATVPVSGSYIKASGSATVDADALAALQTAATSFYKSTGEKVNVAAAYRDLNKQATMFYNNCLVTGTCSPITCNPASSDVVTKSGSKYVLAGEFSGMTSSSAIVSSMVSHASYGNCPHTSAIALDAWCDDGGANYKHDPVCQTQLIQAMISAGFCRLSAEVWHFELNSKKVSSACSTANTTAAYTIRGKTYTPPTNCQKWDFRLHTCTVKRN
ncbi:MAG: pilin [Patescibacteria group bacterium]